MTHLLPLLIGLLSGMALTALLLRQPRRRRDPPEVAGVLEPVPDPPGSGADEPREGSAAHLITLLAESLRAPLRLLRRVENCPPEILEGLEHIGWQARMLVSRPRPMKAQPTSPMTLLQEAAEKVPSLRDGVVTVKWSLLNRQPVHLDPERARAAFRELLLAGASAAGGGGRLAIKIQPSEQSGFPVEVELEIGRRGAEMDSLALLVARHLLEGQGARLVVDSHVTRIALRDAAPELVAVA